MNDDFVKNELPSAKLRAKAIMNYVDRLANAAECYGETQAGDYWDGSVAKKLEKQMVEFREGIILLLDTFQEGE